MESSPKRIEALLKIFKIRLFKMMLLVVDKKLRLHKLLRCLSKIKGKTLN